MVGHLSPLLEREGKGLFGMVSGDGQWMMFKSADNTRQTGSKA